MLVGKVVGLWAGTLLTEGFRGEGGGAREARARTATGDEANFWTTPFFLAEMKKKTIICTL